MAHGTRYALPSYTALHTHIPGTHLGYLVLCNDEIELAGVSNPEDQHYAYADPGSAQTYLTALDQIDAFVSAEGPFDGVFAFSQGAGLAIQYMVRKKTRDPDGPGVFKCAILFAPTAAGDENWYQKTGQMRLLKRLPEGLLLDTPTALIWGAKDEWRDMFEKDCVVWEEGSLWQCMHDGGHEIPGLNMKGAIKATVKVIRRAVTDALSRSEL